MASEVVLPDAQWTMVRYLKPFPNFEQVYQGKSGVFPIAFPGILDVFAQRKVAGYDPNLIAGITVPLGSRVTIWIPQTINDGIEVDLDPQVNALYQYQILWRMRTPRDFRAGQGMGQTSAVQQYSSYHVPTSSFGQPQTVTVVRPDPNALYYLPGSMRTVAFEQSEPVSGVPSVIHLRGEYLQPVSDPIWTPPFTPAGQQAVWQQGTYTNSAAPNTGGPAYLTFTTDVEGDEMTILASKIDPTPDWDFTTTAPGDQAFSNTYGNNRGANQSKPTSAILVTTGTS
jgi:hypothetical protein